MTNRRRSRGPQRLTTALDEVLASLQPPGPRSSPSPSATTVGGVFARWNDVVGPAIAAHAQPVRLADGLLIVEVDDPGWVTQLRFLEADLLERLAAAAGPGVTGLTLRVRRR